MSEVQKPTEEQELKGLKQAHDMYATTCHLLKTRCQFYFEEFLGVQEQVSFYTSLKEQVLTRIHQLEPPKVVEPTKPYIIDAPAAAAPLSVVESGGDASL